MTFFHLRDCKKLNCCFLEDGTAIHIHSASYGRTDSRTCSAGRPASQLAKTDCYALNLQTIVANGSVVHNAHISTGNSVFALIKTNKQSNADQAGRPAKT